MSNETNETNTELNPNRLMDAVIQKLGLKNDAALSRVLDVAPPVISKIRSNALPVGATMKIRIHEIAEMPFAAIHAHLGSQPYKAYAGAM